MILITTPTGHIGKQLMNQLINTDEKLRVFVRDASKLSSEWRQRAEIVEGSLDQPQDLAQAYAGVDDLFLVIPPSMAYDDVDAYYKHFGLLNVQAIREQKVKRVVFVSGTALTLDGKAGAVTASVYVEKMLADCGAAVRILHCGTFMENLLHAAGSIKATGRFGTSCPAEVKAPWVATKDIAGAAALLLLDKSWSGVGAVAVLGPKDINYSEIAEVMTAIAGKKISYNAISADTLKANVQKYGATVAAAQNLADIYSSMERGVFNLVTRTSQNSTSTEVREWLQHHKDIFGF